jgi:hypothetical protein
MSAIIQDGGQKTGNTYNFANIRDINTIPSARPCFPTCEPLV